MLSTLVRFGTTKELSDYLTVLRREYLAEASGVPADAILRFVWQGANADGKPAALSVISDPRRAGESVTSLPGVQIDPTTSLGARRYLDVLLTFDKDGNQAASDLPDLRSLYASTKNEHPLVTQTPGFVKDVGAVEAFARALGPTMISSIPGRGGRAGGTGVVGFRAGSPTVRPPEKVTARVTAQTCGPVLPHKRAKLEIKDRIVTPSTEKSFSARIEETRSELVEGVGRVSSCAANLANDYAKALTTAASCVTGRTSTSACGRTIAAAHATAAASFNRTTRCPTDSGSVGVDPVQSVEEAFEVLVKGWRDTTVEGQLVLSNAPKERWTFGVMTAVRFGRPSFQDARVKVDGGKVVEDPLPRLVNAVVVNWHPKGFDSALATYKGWGGFKMSFGAVVSPDPGFVLAAGYSPIRGLTLNVGRALLLANSPKSGVGFDSEIPLEHRNDPFRFRRIGTWLAGLSYSF